MRLTQYLNEITKVSTSEVEKMLDDGFKDYKTILKKYKHSFWIPRFLKLATAFKEAGIYFFDEGGFLSKIAKIKGSTTGTTSIQTGLPAIWIKLSKKELKSLSTDKGIQKIKEKVKSTMIHELTHRKQIEAMSDEHRKMMVKNRKKLKRKMEKDNYEDYLSEKPEIEAFARQAVEDLEKNDRDILYTYLDTSIDIKSKQRFLKKLYQYLDMYGSDKAKENFKLFLKKHKKLDDILNKIDYSLDDLDTMIKDYEKITGK